MVSWTMRQAPGDTKSGDNDALKAMLDEERAHGRHVGIAPQCSFNSYVWRSRVRDWWRLVYMPNTILLGLYRPGALLWCTGCSRVLISCTSEATTDSDIQRVLRCVTLHAAAAQETSSSIWLVSMTSGCDRCQFFSCCISWTVLSCVVVHPGDGVFAL